MKKITQMNSTDLGMITLKGGGLHNCGIVGLERYYGV